jgi:DHA2 family multidrug resistance protein-like MFS transporter
MALSIAVVGSIVSTVYRALAIQPGTFDAEASHAKQSLGAAHEAAGTLPADKAHDLLAAAQQAVAEGLALAVGVSAALLLASAVAGWVLGQRPAPAPNPCVDELRPS